MEPNNLSIGVAIIVGIIYPAYAIITGEKTMLLLSEQPDNKADVFRETGIYLIGLSILSLLPFLIGGLTLELLGMDFIANPLNVIALIGISFLWLWMVYKMKLSEESANKMMEQNARVQFLLPTNLKEYRHTVALSFIAGICEEIIYRGFLFWLLSCYIPLIPAIILANLPFALAHLTTTGIRNTVGAFVLGLIFTGAYLLTGSLWLSMLLHIMMDLYVSTVSYKAFHFLMQIDR